MSLRTGMIRSNLRPEMMSSLIFAGLWNATTWPGAWPALGALCGWHPPLEAARAYTPLLFPVIGVWLLAAAGHAVWAFWQFGSAVLRLNPETGVIGHALRGTIEIPVRSDDPAGFCFRLRCVLRKRSGNNFDESVLWEDVREQVPAQVGADPTRRLLPVLFPIPATCEPTTTTNDRQIAWRLDLCATRRVLRYGVRFEIPVFVVRDAVLDLPHEGAQFGRRVSVASAAFRNGVRVEVQPADGVCYTFPAAQHVGFGAVLYHRQGHHRPRRGRDADPGDPHALGIAGNTRRGPFA